MISKPTRAQVIGIVAILVLTFLCFLMLSSCSGIKLERRLASDLKAWYGTVNILMETDVPIDIAGGKGITERAYFLRLPYALQTRYREMFWNIRDPDSRAVFESRQAYIAKFMREYERSPMAHLIRLCGLPSEIELYGPGGEYIGQAGILDHKSYDNTVAIWVYYYKSSRVLYGFESKGESWYSYPISAVMVNEQAKFERYWLWLLGPNWNGWDSWKEVLGKRVGE
jgi:hypothetical protein